MAICDRDAVIACAGVPKKDFIDRALSDKLEELVEERTLFAAEESNEEVQLTESGIGAVSCMMPIIAEGDIAGCVVSLKRVDGEMPTRDSEIKLIRTAAGFLGRQLES